MIQEPQHRYLWEAMMDAAGVGVGTDVLDVGCGAGGSSLLMTERGANVTGLDAAEGLLAFARERAPGADFRVGDIEDLPYEDDAFDVVFAANSVQYSADRVATLQGFARVCRPSGRIVAGLLGPPERVAFRVIMGAVRDALPEPPSGGGPFELSMPGVLEGLFEDAGLDVIGVGEVDIALQYADFEAFWRGNASAGPFQGAIQAAGEEAVKASVRNAAEAFMLDDGSIEIRPNAFIYVVASI